MSRSSNERNFGHCAICNCRRTLTRDHVPPSGSMHARRVLIRTLRDVLGQSSERPRFAQGGVHFSSICSECNERRLGQEYDPALNDLASDLERAFSASTELKLVMPNPYSIRCKPQRVARAVIGHLLAAVGPRYIGRPHGDAPMQTALRKYVMNPGASLPKSVSVYCWAFPHREIVVARTIAKFDFRMSAPVLGDILKFYPLGFWIVFQNPGERQWGVPELLPNRATELDAEEEVPFDIASPPHQRFPEAPDEPEGTFFGDSVGIVATLRPVSKTRKGRKPKKKKRKR